MDHIADVFPLIFFLVAALVALTTMTRMVEDDRVQIGTYKALGYGKAAIASKYLIYAAAAAGLGAVVGILVLSQALPRVVTVAYSIIYAVPLMAFPLPVSLPVALMAGGLGVGVTLLATWAAAYSTLREAPATLMLPRAPKAGKRILLENVGPAWRRLSFSWKVTFRNLFRYKRRLLMTVIGISGCTALLLVGFGMRDSIWDIIDLQFGSIVHYDTTVGLTTDATELEVADVSDYLRSTGSVSDQVRVQQENMQAAGTGASTSATATTATTVVIPQDSAALPSAVSLRDRVRGSQVSFDDDAVVVSEKLAALHNVKVGDSIVLYDQDDVGNAVGDGHALTVTGIAENYVRNYVYVGREAWKGVSDVAPTFSTIWCNIPDASARAGISSHLHDLGDVSTVIFSNEIIDQYRHMLTAVNMVVVVLIVSAASLAFIVLYNLTNINVDERVREIASLKVLGFTRREVYAYVFREIILLTLIGDAVGLALGVFLERFVITTAEVDYVMFGRTIHLPSFAFAFVLTLAFSGVVMLIMRHKLDRIDMVESLKSVE
ncbi:ABC transporter permease [Olsenella massiliensis]|uniref:ABC transporter permease n=1 Tax=Olsenella massiliensis TaxID=1622075 RepID=UPI00071E48EB|nr:ABC transporter permease [Olsenella massiliensis]